jgi:hypothetical protein
MFDWNEIVRLESNDDFLKRLSAIATCDYIQNEAWLLLKIKQLIETRLNVMEED